MQRNTESNELSWYKTAPNATIGANGKLKRGYLFKGQQKIGRDKPGT